MSEERRDDQGTLGHVPIEPPTEGDSGATAETDLPGNGDDGGVDQETKKRLHEKVAAERRRRERAELGLPVDEAAEATE